MIIRLSLTWIDSRISLPVPATTTKQQQQQPKQQQQQQKMKTKIPLTIEQRQLIWMPNFVTTFRTKIFAESFRSDADFVTLDTSRGANVTKVQLQVYISPTRGDWIKNYTILIICINYHHLQNGLAFWFSRHHNCLVKFSPDCS